MGRAAEALPWYEKAIKLAPTRRDLRLALISQLAGDQKFAEAAVQYEALDQAEPNNPDTLRDWGALVLRDTTKPAPERKAAAAAIWQKMLVAKPNDPVTTAQVADLLAPGRIDRRCPGPLQKGRRAGTRQSPVSRIHRRIPPQPQTARRSQGRLGQDRRRHQQERQEPRTARRGLRRLRLPQRGRSPRSPRPSSSTPTISITTSSWPTICTGSRRYDDAETELAAAGKLAEKDEEKDAVLEARRQERPGRRPRGPADRLAHERSSTPPRARRPSNGAYWPAISRPTASCPRRSAPPRRPSRSSRARSRPGRWRPGSASRPAAWPTPADALRRLAEIDRRNRTEHLMGIAKLESRLGRVDARH